MKKLLAAIVLAAIAALVAHYMRWIDLPFTQLPRRDVTADDAPARRGRGGAAGRTQPPPPVIAAVVTRESVPVTVDAVGTIQALNTVVVRAQIEGRLIALEFTEGQDVKAGDVIARIDPRPAQAQYDQAVAKKAQDEAQLANARIDLDRYQKLATGNFGTRQQADTQRALVAQLQAQVRMDQAAIDAAKTTLDFTTIVAPIGGRTGIRAVDVGNIVRNSDPAGVVTITQVRPIAMIFALPQQHLPALRAAQAAGAVAVQALEADNRTVIASGQVDVIDNTVDATTGTVKVKARFANDDQRLWPGQFVNVRVFLGALDNVVVAPTAAVQRGPTGPYVYVVGDDRKAKQTNVVVTRQDETRTVIASGVEPGARVITTGFVRISDGDEVAVTMDGETNASGDGPNDARRNPQQQRRRGR